MTIETSRIGKAPFAATVTTAYDENQQIVALISFDNQRLNPPQRQHWPTPPFATLDEARSYADGLYDDLLYLIQTAASLKEPKPGPGKTSTA